MNDHARVNRVGSLILSFEKEGAIESLVLLINSSNSNLQSTAIILSKASIKLGKKEERAQTVFLNLDYSSFSLLYEVLAAILIFFSFFIQYVFNMYQSVIHTVYDYYEIISELSCRNNFDKIPDCDRFEFKRH